MNKQEAARTITQMWIWAIEQYYETGETEFLVHLPANNERLSSGYLRFHISIDHLTQDPRWIASMLDIPSSPYNQHHIRADYVPAVPDQGLERASAWIETCGVHIPKNWEELAMCGSSAIKHFESLLQGPEHDEAA